MILDTLANQARYAHLHPAFPQAFRFLDQLDPAQLTVGRIDVDGDRLFALIMKPDGKGHTGTRLETHRNYIDIQYQVAGVEHIGWSSADHLAGEGYNAEKDIEFYQDEPETWTVIHPGRFAIFFPCDAHAPLGGTGSLVKVVMKIRG